MTVISLRPRYYCKYERELIYDSPPGQGRGHFMVTRWDGNNWNYDAWIYISRRGPRSLCPEGNNVYCACLAVLLHLQVSMEWKKNKMHRRHLVLFLHSLLSVVSLKHLQLAKKIFQTDRKWGFKWSDEQWFTSPFWKTIEVRCMDPAHWYKDAWIYVLDIENATEDKEKRMQTFLQNPFLKKNAIGVKKTRVSFF